MHEAPLRPAVVRTLLIALLVVLATLLGAFDYADALLTDHLFRARPEKLPDARVAVIGITDQCLQQLGQWPWPRARHAELIRKVAAAHPALILCDIVFGEPSHLGPADDAALEAALRDAGDVVLPITLASTQKVDPGALAGFTEGHGWIDASAGLTSLAPFNAAAAYVGHVHFTPDADGIVRSYVPLLRAAGKPYLALPLVAAARLHAIKLDRAASTALPLLRAMDVQTADSGRVPINFLGRSESPFEILPYSEVLAGAVPARAFADRVVIVGGAAVGLHDSKTTPFGLMYGMEILAHATSNLIAGNPLRLPLPLTQALFALLAALLAGFLTARLGPVAGPLLAAAALFGWWRLAIFCFDTRSRVLPLCPVFSAAALASAGIALQSAALLFRRRREETEARRRVDHALSAAAADLAAGRLQLGLERLAALPEQSGDTALRVRALTLRALVARPEEPALEAFLDREDLAPLPTSELLAAAALLEEAARHDLAERVLNVLRAQPLPPDLAAKVDDDRERVATLKKQAGLASPLLPLARRTLGDGYRKVVFLGVGGMGFVVKALWVERDRWVAVKFLSPTFVQHKDIRERFERETRILSGLRHPHIIEVLSSSLGEQPYYSMEFFQGKTLGELLSGSRRLPLSEAARIVIPTARALAYAHQANLVHRDVKPGNVLLGPDGTVKLTDFGIAKSFEMTDLTPTGEMLGTPDYMSPEQVQGETKKMNALTDVYALGVMLYEMLTAELPFPRGSHPFMRVGTPPIPVESHGVELPPPIVALIMTALATEQADRTISCADFAAVLAPFNK